jgi:predicted pyridoxine 5'-phosphate oxidase superfamily flavin-nucleotide-binding protein
MTQRFAELAFTPNVRNVQTSEGSRDTYARLARRDEPGDALGPEESEFLEQRDSFYLATVRETGWPYVQHRGGPAGFLKVLKVERGIVIKVAAFDWNCPQHITPRFSSAEVASIVAPLRERIAELEARLRENDRS